MHKMTFSNSTTAAEEKSVNCERCGAEKQCISYQCCHHSPDWFYMQGMSSATCRICGGTVTNPDFHEGQQTFPEKVRSLEAKLKVAREALEEIARKTVGGCGEDVIADHALSQLSL